MANPTNSDIVKLITLHHEDNAKELSEIKAQVKYTNGRVTSIENWKNALEAVEAYKKENPNPQVINAKTVNVAGPWFQNEKLASAVAFFVLALASAISFFVGQGGAK